jgi:hypothetical protein
MLGYHPCISASCALSARLMQAEFPPQTYAPPRGDKTQTPDRSMGVTQVPTTPLEPSRASVRPSTRTARDGFRSRFRVTEPAPTRAAAIRCRSPELGFVPGYRPAAEIADRRCHAAVAFRAPRSDLQGLLPGMDDRHNRGRPKDHRSCREVTTTRWPTHTTAVNPANGAAALRPNQ